MDNGALRRSLLTLVLLGPVACAAGDAGTTEGSGGSSSGGVSGGTGSGGVKGSGGAVGTGGSAASGGAVGTGGKVASGGTVGSTGGAAVGSGGAAPGTGGRGTAGAPPTGGQSGAAGGASSGGATGMAGRFGSGGAGGGGAPGTGGVAPGTGGAGGAYVGTKMPGMAQSGDITVDPAKTYQVVDGFGEADVWQNSSSTAMQALLFDPVNGIGLTLLRVGIESVSGKSVLMGSAGVADGKACMMYAGSACKVWAAPWSPPASMKDNNSVNGGASNNTLKTADYDAWATLLAAFPAYYKQQSGVDLYAISAQNEPDFNPTYEACVYDKTQMVNWIKVLGPKLAALSPPVKVLAAEPDNWGNLWGGDSYGPAIIADSTANMYVGPIATHDYGNTSAGTYGRPAPPANNTHHVWETECTPGDTGPITIATMIYAAFTTGGVNAWHYWWTQALVPNVNSPPPQVYALGNFSKFVRPGYYRVDVSGAPKPSGTVPLVVAFTNKPDATVAVVVVNGGSAQQASFFVAGTAWPASVTPYVTTSSAKLAAAAPITVSAGRWSASLAAQSVTTFVGKP